MPDPIVNKSAERYIPVARPSLTEAEAQAAYDCVKSGWISQGPLVEKFEQEFSAAHERSWGAACNSGTSAICLALAAAGVGPGDKVIVPTLTMIACGNAILYRGAEPVFVDSEPATGNADPREVERLEAAGIRPAAVIAVHLYGAPCHDFIEECSTAWPGAIIIEDCCEAHYGRAGGKSIGSLGHLATFSFFSNKITCTGEGGMVIGDDRLWERRVKSLRSHAFDPLEHFNHKTTAYGYRMTDIQAAIGLVQHGRQKELVAKRLEIVAEYRRRISYTHLHCRSMVESYRECVGWAPWVFPIICGDEVDRAKVRLFLAQNGIETRTFFKPLHRQRKLAAFAGPHEKFPVADDLSAVGLYLPVYPDMTKDDVAYACNAVERAFR